MEERGTITFSGTGEIITTSTIARVSFTFSELDDDVAKARTVVSEKVKKAYDTLQNLSVEERDIRTTDYTIYPEYEYLQPTAFQPDRRELRGYRVSHTTDIRMRNPEKTGEILDAVSNLQPTNIGDLTFTLDNKERKRLEEQALSIAIQEAKEKAKRISKRSGLRLGKITDIQINDYIDPYREYNYSVKATSFVESTPTPIARGEDTITKTVTVTYEMKRSYR